MKTKFFLLGCALVLSGLVLARAQQDKNGHGDHNMPAAKPEAEVVVNAPNAAVKIAGGKFNAKNLRVKIGATVTWTNNDGGAVHTVTADKDEFSSGNLADGQAFSHTFSKAGTYRYYCVYHGGKGGEGMSGVVKVTKK